MKNPFMYGMITIDLGFGLLIFSSLLLEYILKYAVQNNLIIAIEEKYLKKMDIIV